MLKSFLGKFATADMRLILMIAVNVLVTVTATGLIAFIVSDISHEANLLATLFRVIAALALLFLRVKIS